MRITTSYFSQTFTEQFIIGTKADNTFKEATYRYFSLLSSLYTNVHKMQCSTIWRCKLIDAVDNYLTRIRTTCRFYFQSMNSLTKIMTLPIRPRPYINCTIAVS